MDKRFLFGLTLSELQGVVKSLGMPAFAAKQIASWLYQKKIGTRSID
jgi:23S rRNA (adenine2503-C2)-methyltransferase